MTLFDAFSAAFDGPCIPFLGGSVELIPADRRLEKLQALADHPLTPSEEREAALRAADRIRSRHVSE